MGSYKTLFISDIHLGTSLAQADKLIDFLQKNTFEKIYLVGDIIDMIAMKRKFYWKKKHNKSIQELLKLSKKSEVVYIIGNHDIYLESFVNEKFGNILIKERDVHITERGEKCLVIHGHQFDGAIMTYTWLYLIGSKAYDISIYLSNLVTKIRRLLGLSHWSLSMYLKAKTKSAIKFINNFEYIVAEYALEQGVDTVIAGHIHMKEDKVFKLDKEVRYLNCGCFTEFTSCVIETLDGELRLIDV